MKIVQLIASLSSGGAERFTVDLSNELSKDNEVYLLTFRDYPDADFYRSQLLDHVKQVRYRGNFTFISKIKQLFVVTYYLLKIKPDVIHTHDIAISYAVIYKLLVRRVKVYYTVHSLAKFDTNKGFSFFVRKILLKSLIHPVTISERCRRSFFDYYGYDSFCTIENGCRDLLLSDKIDEVRKEIRSYCPSKNTKVYVCVARVMQAKNHAMLIEVFNRMVSRGDDVVLLLIGRYDQNSDLKKSLDASVKTDRIHFLGTRTNIPDYLAISDYFCLSSLWEGLPISIIEAGLSGCYPICTPVGGIVDVIKNEKWGMLSKDLSADEFIKAIDRAKSIAIERSELVKMYKERFSMVRCAKEYMQMYMR